MKDRLDWAALLAVEARTKAVVRSDELARKYGLSDSSVLVTLRRQEKRGLVERVSSTIYLNKLATGFSAKDVVNLIRPHSYVSLESALQEWGVSTQSPVGLSCVSTSHARTIRTSSVLIEFREIKKELFWGFTEKTSRYGTYKIAEPEKALLDWLYFRLSDGLPIQLDEIQFQNINPPRLFQYAKKFPSSVFEAVISTLLERVLGRMTHP